MLVETLKNFLVRITLPADKANHAMYGLFVYGLLSLFNPMIAIAVVVVIGISKEILDSYIGGTVDKFDGVATIAPSFVLYVIYVVVGLL